MNNKQALIDIETLKTLAEAAEFFLDCTMNDGPEVNAARVKVFKAIAKANLFIYPVDACDIPEDEIVFVMSEDGVTPSWKSLQFRDEVRLSEIK